MFTRLYVDNYRCLVNFELKLGELTLLLGPNGVGKSSVLDVVFATRQLLNGIAKLTDPGIFPTTSLTRWQKNTTQVIEIDVLVGQDAMTYRLEVQHDRESRRARLMLERLSVDGQPLFECAAGTVQLYRDNHSAGPKYSVDWSESALARVASTKENTRLSAFLEAMRKVVVCRLYPSTFAGECASEDPSLLRDGSNFAAWYRHFLQERPDLVAEFERTIAEVLPAFGKIRLEKVGQDTRAFLVSFGNGATRHELRLDELSDGQRALIAIYALIHITRGQGYTLFLDEPENYVALSEIQPWLMALNDACGDGVPQAVLCSHHPELIDYLGAERGVVLAREVGGAIVARALVPQAEKGSLKLSEAVSRGWQ